MFFSILRTSAVAAYKIANSLINKKLESISDTNNTTDITGSEAEKVKLLFVNNVYDSREVNSDYIYGRMNLFGTSLYYAQNGETKPSGEVYDEIVMKTKMAKAYLWLHTIPFDFEKIMSSPSYFRKGNQTTGGIEGIPYLYLVFLGALLWRRKYKNDNNIDPIRFPSIYNNTSQTPDRSLLFNTSNGFKLVFQSKTDNMTPAAVNTFISDNLDIHVANALITLFSEFVGDTWPKIETMFEPIIIDNETRMPRPIYLDDFSTIASTANKYTNKRCDELVSLCFGEGLSVGGGRFTLNNTMFRLIMPYDNNNIMLFLFRTDGLMNVISEIYKTPTYVLTTGYVNNNQPTVTNVPQNFAKSYITQFASTLDTLTMKAINYDKAGYPVDDNMKQLRDFHITMYMYFKNLWDKWLNAYYNSNENIIINNKPRPISESFHVEYYFSHFLFMDSFYRNIFKKLKLNCGTLLEHFTNRTNNYNMFSYLGAVASSHQCMFLSIPDYINLGDDDDTVAERNLADLFRPMPANTIPPPQMENRFIVMYTHQPSSVTTVDKSDFRVDSFDIWSENDGRNVQKLDVFNRRCGGGANEDDYTQINRYGYNVPSFGIAYSRQNNNIFKSVKASMDNPVMTEQSVLALGAIAELGNSTEKKVCFYGQDVYPIYSNNSYIIEVEMMGNAQIQPLMYFQLMNIPMYRGTYMIISVTHNMTQGNMTTTIKATKMSKYATPFVSNWFTIPPDREGDSDGGSVLYSSHLIATDGTVMDVTDCKFANAVNTVYGIKYNYGSKSVENGLDCSGFTHYVYRKAYDVEISEGSSTQLQTFQQMDVNGKGTCVEVSITKEKQNYDEFSKKAVCGDVLFMGVVGETTIKHVALYMGYINGKHYIAEASSSKGVTCRDADHSSLATENEQYEIKYIGHWSHTPDNSGCTKVYSGSADETFTGVLTTVKITNQEQQTNGYKIMDRLVNKGFKLNRTTVRLTPMQAAAVAGVWFQESGWNPQAVNSESYAYGLAQWLGARKYENYRAYCKEKGINNRNDVSAMKTLDEQMDYAEWEFNREYFKDTCHLWGEDVSYRNRWGWKCGNLMIYKGDMNYTDAKLYDLVYRFTVAYENGNSPAGSEFAIQNRAKYAKSAYELYMKGRNATTPSISPDIPGYPQPRI